MERRLAAILAADVVGYTALVGADEAGTLGRLTKLRTEFLEPLVASHKGRVVKLMGDGMLVEFASVVDAVVCALAWQDGVGVREAGADEGRQLRFRIGINLGDIIVGGDDIFGDGVNVAARLEGLAEPGGIRISDTVFQSVKGKLDLGFADLGPKKVKNLADPIVAYQVLLNPEDAGRLVEARRHSGRDPKVLAAVILTIVIGVFGPSATAQVSKNKIWKTARSEAAESAVMAVNPADSLFERFMLWVDDVTRRVFADYQMTRSDRERPEG